MASRTVARPAAIGDIRNDNDANCTYEGENSLLLQQTSNWLLGVWGRRHQLTAEHSPLGSLEFLYNVDDTLNKTCPWNSVDQFAEPANLVEMYRWLTAYTLKMTHEKVSRLKRDGNTPLQAKNDSQAYHAVALSVIYGENYILNHFYKTASSFPDAACREVLLQLVALYGGFLLEKHMATLQCCGGAGASVRRRCRSLTPWRHPTGASTPCWVPLTERPTSTYRTK
ncbi:unnamed protein product [Leptidea sinapis]|uniref:Acyl-CoA oxidase C-terminal domain-containing protein n=1 Tax=Leptidea sinapis TaxID=189913 RepID=A0A5E4Q9F3_9NEOP|nr:unnamed protein product [Leptidea sinapis]